MQKICLVIALSALLSVAFADQPEVEDDVYVLTDANFDEFVNSQEFLLVEFYAPWCGHCKALAPEYSKAAKRLRENNPPYYLAKLDATEHKTQAEKHGIRGFPTLFFFKNGQKNEYTGGRTENEIVNWILKKVGPPSSEVTCDALKEKAASNKLVLAFFGETSSKEYSVFLDVARAGDIAEKFQIVHVLDKDCAATHGVSQPGLLIFRQFDTSPVTYSGSWENASIVEWMRGSSVPTVIEFSEDYIEPIFGQKQPAIFLFRSSEDASSTFAKNFEAAANQLKGKILFVVSGVTDGIQARLAEFIGADSSSIPSIKILDPTDNMKKYQYESSPKDATVESISAFINTFKTGSLSPFFKSEEIPEDKGEALKVVVGKSFKQIVLNEEDDVLIKFYAPWCGHCKKLAPIWDQLADELKSVPHLVIAKLDSTANEIEGLDIRGYPTLKFYHQGNKQNPVDYEGERDLEGLKNWLKENSQAYKKYLEQKSEL